MTAPRLPELASTDKPWGPPAAIPTYLKFNDVPYAPFSKGDKLGKVADWASDPKDSKDNRKQQHRYRDPYHAYGANSASFFTNEEPDNVSAFSIVDSTKQSAPKPPRTQNAVLKTRGQGGNTRGGGFTRGRGGARGGAVVNVGNTARHSNRRHGWKDFDNNRKTREPSLKIQEDMNLLQTVAYSNLQKLSFDVQTGEELGSYGYVNHYNRSLEKPNSNLKLEALDRTVYNVSTSDDPVIQDLASKKTGLVYATDAVISLLMTVTKTVNPWDIIVNKKDGQIFLDKREDGPLDYVTVDENAYDAPADFSDKDSNLNSATKLGLEATYINKNFTANAVATSQQYNLDKPNPFASGDEPLLASGYRYKKYNLASDPEAEPVNLVVRTQFDAVQPGPNGGDMQYVSVQALNEYGGANGALEWKNKFTNQRGAIVAAEMKNNLSKLSRWTVQSILADVKSMKIGFVSRTSPKSNSSHVIVGVLGRDPNQFASQLNVNMRNGWGIVKSVVNIVSALDDGKYVLMKDPNMPQIWLYDVQGGKLESE